MTSVYLTIENKSLIQSVKDLNKQLSDFTLAFSNVGDYLLMSHASRFEKNESPSGAKWVDNADSTYLAYAYAKTRGSRSRVKGKGTKNQKLSRGIVTKEVLRWDHVLLSHLHYNAYRNKLVFSTPIKSASYAAAMQFGVNKAGRPKIPARPYLGVSTKDKSIITQELVNHIRKGWMK